jgi:hypothetical protein
MGLYFFAVGQQWRIRGPLEASVSDVCLLRAGLLARWRDGPLENKRECYNDYLSGEEDF